MTSKLNIKDRAWLASILVILMNLGNGCKQIGETKNSSHVWTEEERTFLIKGLEDSKNELHAQLSDLDNRMWFFKSDSGQWSIAKVVEHLELQESMHYREVYVLSNTPQPLSKYPYVKENDKKIMNYETDPTPGSASFFVIPRGRWQNRTAAVSQFDRTRDKMISWVSGTDKDLRSYYTFRVLPDPGDYRAIRDLHQIILTTVAHTRRHIHQIERIKSHPEFPQANTL